jgi:transketolase
MRNAFAAAVTELAATDGRVVLLSGDIGNRLFDKFKASAPTRFYNCGVAEQNMVTVAAGMALCGLRPIVYTITPFTTTRVFEQIRVDVCYHKAPVTIVGTGSGLSYASLGPTHHSVEDIAILRTLPGMTVLAPADAAEVKAAIHAAVQLPGPCYIRIGKKGEPAVHREPPKFEIGKPIIVREGTDVCLFAVGTMTAVALDAATRLSDNGVSARVVSFHTVKPLDESLVADAFDRYKVVAAIEEHGRIGGLGSVLAEWLAARDPYPPARLLSFGTPDAFFCESGSQEYAREKLGLTATAIATRVAKALQRRTAPC